MDTDYIKSTGLRWGIGVVFCLFLLLFEGMGWLEPVYDWGNFVLEPLEYWSGEMVKSGENLISTVTNIGGLRSENVELKVENAKLQSQADSAAEIEKENEILREQVGIEMMEDWTIVKVRILGLDEDGMAEHVVIDGGREDEITNGDVVVLGDMMVGKVQKVSKSTSLVRLVTNQDSNIIAIDQRTRAKGLVRGSLDGLVMEDVLENEELKDDDIVVSWADDIPPGLVIGRISKVEDVPTSSTKRAFIETGINAEELSYVFVVVDY